MKKGIYFLCCFCLCLAAGCNEINDWPEDKFDSTIWQATAEEERYRFAKDLVSSKILEGLTRTQVIELLGVPSDESISERMYYIIKQGGSGFDQVYVIELRLQENGNIIETYLIRGD